MGSGVSRHGEAAVVEETDTVLVWDKGDGSIVINGAPPLVGSRFKLDKGDSSATAFGAPCCPCSKPTELGAMIEGKTLQDIVKIEIVKTVSESRAQYPPPAPRNYICQYFVAIAWSSGDKSIVTHPDYEEGIGSLLGSGEFTQIELWKKNFAERLSRFLGVGNNLADIHTLRNRVELVPTYGDTPADYVQQRDWYLTEIERAGVTEEDLVAYEKSGGIGRLGTAIQQRNTLKSKFAPFGGWPVVRYWDQVRTVQN